MKHYHPYFGWNPAGLSRTKDDKTIKDDLMEPCTEMGCIKGSILLLYSRLPCKACGGTGMVKKPKDK